jgi:MFS transporter, DHA1 family, multidrug resistance protein
VTLYLVGLGLGQLVYGPLSDRFGRRPTIVISLAIYTLGLGLAIPVRGVGSLIAARLLQSLGACGSLVLGRAMVRDSAAGGDVVRRMSLLMITMTLTPLLAPALGGYISSLLGWRAIFVILTIAVGTLLALVALTLPETNRNPTPLPNIGSIFIAYARLLRLPSYPNYAAAGAFCTTSVYAFLSAAPFIFVDVLHRSPDQVGLYCLMIIAGMIIGAALARQAVSKISIRTAARCGAAICLVGALGLLAVDLAHLLSVPTVIAPMLIFSLGMGIAAPNAVAGLMNAAPNAIGAASSFYGFGQMSFGALATMVVALWNDGSALPVASVLVAAATMALVALRKV